ncbi:MAG TPA: ROK family protein [Terriglobia bacterium]|nr:ROK family protein [Terriglobia bacterium]
MENYPGVEVRLEDVLKEITDAGRITLNRLAPALNARSASLSKKLRPLLREGLIRTATQRKMIELNPEYGCVVGIDMGASHLHYALADFRGDILRDATEKIRPEDGPARLIAQIKEGLRRMVTLAANEHPGGKTANRVGKQARRPFALRGIAIGVPSPVDPVSGAVAFANNLPGWKNIHLARALEKEFRLPVVIENDANMAALGERWRGVARGVQSFVFIALGTGIGSGIVVDGNLVRGRTGSAGELFRLNVEWPRWDEDFGDIGYFETHVSGMGIAREGRKRLGAAANPQPGNLAAERDAYFVFEAFRQGNPQARAALIQVFTMLGVGISDIVAILDPDLIVLGGGVVKGAPKLLLTTLNRVVTRIQKEITPPIKISALEDKAQTYGAIYCALICGQKAALRRLT